MYTFKEHIGNCQGVGIMNLEAKGQRGTLYCQFLGKQRKKRQDADQGGGEVHNYKRLFHGAKCLLLFRFCISKL